MRYLMLAMLLTVQSVGMTQEPPPGKAPSDGRKETLLKGVELHDSGRYEAAIKVYETLLKENPDDGLVLYEIAFSYMAMKNYEKCIDFAQRSASLPSETQPQALGTLASCYDDSGKIKEALETFERAAALFPTNSSLHFNYAVTLLRQNDPDKARGYLRTAIENAPRYPSPYRIYATLLGKEGNQAGAIFMNLRLIMLEGQSPRVIDAAKEVAHLTVGASKKTKGGGLSINLDWPQSGLEREGKELNNLSVALGIALATVADKLPADHKEADEFVSVMQTFLTVTGDMSDSGLKDSFVWKHAIEPMLDLGTQGVMLPFLYHVAYQARMDGAEQWLRANGPELRKLGDALRKPRPQPPQQ